jgi:methionyl aminopeptidase
LIYYKTPDEIEGIRQSNLLVSATLAMVAAELKPGMKPTDIDRLAEQFIRDHGGTPAFKGYKGFPATCCISVNEEVVHGIPNNYEIEDGDIVSVDIGTILNSWVGDSAYTFGIGQVNEAAQQLMRVTKASLYKGIEQAQIGNRIGDIGWAVQEYTEKQHGYGVVRELTGHGVGKKIHESPEVPNYGKRGSGIKLQEGLVIAIEPMINLGKKDVYVADDDWTIVANDGKVSAHYEHSIAITKNGPDILSTFSGIEQAEKANTHLIYPY